MGSMRKSHIALIALAVVLVTACAYYFLWRPSDKTYDEALSQVELMQSNSEAVTRQLSLLTTPASILNSSMVSEFDKRVEAYKQALVSLDKSAVFNRDFRISSTYREYKPTLLNHGKAAENLLASFKALNSTFEACNSLRANLSNIHTSSEFENEAKACITLLEKEDPSPDTEFNDQLFKMFRTRMNNLVAAYRQAIEAGNDKGAQTAGLDAMSEATNQFAKMKDTELQLYIQPDPSERLQKLANALREQKTTFLR